MSNPAKAFQQALERQAGVRVAKVVLDPKVLERIRRMTQGNHASESFVLGAEALGATHLAAKFKLILQLVKLEGYKPAGLNDYQYAVYQEMMKQAKQVLDEQSYQEFYNSF